MNERPRVLVKEKLADSGVDLLREHFDVDLGVDWEDGELPERIGDYDAIVIRSATKLTADLIERATRMPKPRARAATSWPMRPKPSTPRVFS